MTNSARPFSIRIFVPGGDPDGLRIVEKSNWTGVGVVFNRSAYREVASRPEFDRTGVYVLVGDSEVSALPTVYVGEGDPVKDRLYQHHLKKDFWQWSVFFVSKDSSLNKAHVQHLEARLFDLATSAKLCKLDNSQKPLPPTLSEAERADVECFLLDILSICPLIGLSVFEKADSAVRNPSAIRLAIAARGIAASGYEDPRGFIVCQGSEFAETETPSLSPSLRTFRADLVATGVVATVDGRRVFTQDQVFSSPSTASSGLGRRHSRRTVNRLSSTSAISTP